MDYVAFLRGINLGKRNALRMDDLRGVCGDLGWASVNTHLQTGNVVFSSSEPDLEVLATQLENALLERGLLAVSVMLRSRAEMVDIAEENPFEAFEPKNRTYISLLRHSVVPVGLEPHRVGELELVRLRPAEVLPHRIPEATQDVYPNAVLERKFKTPATTRYWSVFQAVLELLE